MDFIRDSVMEMFYYFRLGKANTDQSSVLYFSSVTGTSSVHDCNELPEQDVGTKRLVLVSDTHDRYGGLTLPKGDIFIHAGDILMTASKISASRGEKKLQEFNEWLGTLNFTEKLIIGGNHDKPIELLGTERTQQILSNATYLQNESFEVDSMTFFGCPLSSGHSHNDSFQSTNFAKETREILNNTSLKEVDILISHGPNFNIAKALQPQLHVWGHAHHYYGIYRPGEELWGYEFGGISVCPSIMTTKYAPDNLPIVVDFCVKR
jgi:hypothetical protein